MVSYADFITLLFAFFVVMYSLSSLNEGKYRVMSDSVVQAFRSIGTHDAGRQVVAIAPIPSIRPAPATSAEAEEQRRAKAERVRNMAEEIRKVLAPLVADGQVRVTEGAFGITVEINAAVLFAPGEAQLGPDAVRALRAVAQVVGQGVGRALAQGAAAYQNGAWQAAYLAMAASMSVGVVTVLFSREPVPVVLPPAKNAAEWIKGAVVDPFADFLGRYGWQAAQILALIAVYRISDVVMGIMANPFYVDMGFTKDEVAAVTKVYGVIMTLVGAFVGGVLSMRLGVMRILMLGAVLSAGSNLLFAWLAGHGHDVTALIAVVSADNLASGIASAAFIAYLSSLTNVSYSATQYALFSSMMLLLPKFVAGFSGDFVDSFGYAQFFTTTSLLGLPVLGLVWLASRVQKTSISLP